MNGQKFILWAEDRGYVQNRGITGLAVPGRLKNTTAAGILLQKTRNRLKGIRWKSTRKQHIEVIIQVAVYDGDTLKLKRVFPFRADTGQLECSGIAVDPESGTVYMTSWIDDESSKYLYMYDLDTGEYKGKMKMQPSPKWLQGIACHNGILYVTCDDGDADENAPDHMYRIEVSEDKETGRVILEKTFDDVIRQGEIEGLTFDKDRGQLLLLYNRGARIIAGMPSGFYEGYTQELHEVFVYDIVED